MLVGSDHDQTSPRQSIAPVDLAVLVGETFRVFEFCSHRYHSNQGSEPGLKPHRQGRGFLIVSSLRFQTGKDQHGMHFVS
jgi:hypothetical protein